MVALFIIGHLVLGLYFLQSGITHFFKADYLAGYASSKGVPFAKFSVMASGALFALGGISLIGWTGFRPDIGIGLIILALLPITTMVHNFWMIKDPMHRATEEISFMKNVAIIAALMLILAYVLAIG
jgi:putative oxidoreductase